MYEQLSNWIISVYSLFDPTNFLPSLPNLCNKQIIVLNYSNDTRLRDTDVHMGSLILFWVILYLLYDKCFNLLFRCMHCPLIQRNRIIGALWNCGFCVGSICYIKLLAMHTLSFTFCERKITYQEFGIMLHKSFYLHKVGIDILCYGTWIKGCANLLFASFILNSYQQNHRWYTITNTFLIYKNIDIMIINVCRILFYIFHIFRRPICKLLFLLHCLIWIFLYLYYVPIFMLWSEEYKCPRIGPGLWFWFAAECLNSVWLRLIALAKSKHWLEICLFPPLTQEAIELAGIHKRHKESLKKFNNKSAKRTELWQMLVCAMAIKRRIRRIRQDKNKDISTEDFEKRTVSHNCRTDPYEEWTSERYPVIEAKIELKEHIQKLLLDAIVAYNGLDRTEEKSLDYQELKVIKDDKEA